MYITVVNGQGIGTLVTDIYFLQYFDLEIPICDDTPFHSIDLDESMALVYILVTQSNKRITNIVKHIAPS